MSRRALCCRIQRSDSTYLLTTSLDRDLIVTATGYEGTYSAKNGLTAGNLKSSGDLSVNNTEAKGALRIEGLTATDITAGLYDHARVTIFQTDWSDPSSVFVLGTGTLGAITRDSDGNYTAEYRSLAQALQQTTVNTFQKNCRADLGSGSEVPLIRRCGLNLTPYTVTGTVTSVEIADRAFTDSAREEPNNWFTYGYVTFTSGANAGFKRAIKRHQLVGAIELVEQLPFDIEVGDEYSMTPGCNKQWRRDTQKLRVTRGGTVLVDAAGNVSVLGISGTTTTSGSVGVSSGTATFTGDGTLTIVNAAGTIVVQKAGSTVNVTDAGLGPINSIAIGGKEPTGDCWSKFNNGPNFRGHPFIPGADTLLRATV